MFAASSFHELASARGDLLLSLYLPLHIGETGRREDPLRLKTLLTEARALAREEGHAARAIDAACEPLDHLIKEDGFWQDGGAGIALFADDGRVHTHRAAVAYDALAFVKNRFAVRPLLRDRVARARWLVLALSGNAARLFECTTTREREMKLDLDLGELASQRERGQLQMHGGAPVGGGRRATQFHGQGGPSDRHESESLRALRAIDVALAHATSGSHSPLVLAGVAAIAKSFRGITRWPNVLEPAIEGNPDRLDARALRAASEPIALRAADAPRAKAIERMCAPVRASELVTETASVLAAAHAGKVATLLVRDGAPLWGRFDPSTGVAKVRESRKARDDDLLDLAVSYVVPAGGHAHAVPAATIPGNAPMAALLRA